MNIAKEVIAKNYGIVRYNKETDKYLLRNRNDKTQTVELDYEFLCDIEELAADLEYCDPHYNARVRARNKRAFGEYLNSIGQTLIDSGSDEDEDEGSGATGTAKPVHKPKPKKKPKNRKVRKKSF